MYCLQSQQQDKHSITKMIQENIQNTFNISKCAIFQLSHGLLVNGNRVLDVANLSEQIKHLITNKNHCAVNDISKDREFLLQVKMLLGLKSVTNAALISIVNCNRKCSAVMFLCNQMHEIDNELVPLPFNLVKHPLAQPIVVNLIDHCFKHSQVVEKLAAIDVSESNTFTIVDKLMKQCSTKAFV